MRKIIHRYTVLLLTVLLVGTGIALADTDVVVLGDVNSDGSVTTADVTVLVNYLHGSGTVDVVAADVNRDGAIDIADVTAINNIISSGTFDKGTASTLFFPTATVEKSYGDAAFTNQLVRSGSTGAITYTSSATGVATVNTTTGEVTIQGAGTATITATLAANGGISGTTASYTVNVAQATNSLTTTPVLASTSQDFTGSPVTLVTTEGAALYGSVEYSTTSATEGFSTTVPTATNAGDYTVWYRVPGTASYTAIDAVKLGTVTISKATMTGITATAYSAAYDGEAHGITVNGVPDGATVTYGTTEGTYDQSENPTYTDVAAARTVYFKVSKANYSDFTGSSTVTITQATNSFTAQPTIAGWTYGESANAPTGGAVQFGTPTYKYSASADGEYGTYDAVVNGQAGTWYVKGFVEGTTNYAAATSDAVSFTIANATMTGITATAYSAAYDGEAHGITVNGVPDGATVTYGTTEGTYDQSENPTYTDVAAARTVYFKVSKANYSDFTGSSTVTITQATNSFTAQPTIAGWTYGESANAPTGGAVQFGTPTYKYSASADGEYGTYDAVVNGQAGTWYVKGFVEATTNYAAATSNAVSFTVNKVAATVTTAPAAVTGDLTFSGSAQTLFTVGSDVTGGTLKYKVTTSSTKPDNTNDFTTTIDQQTNAGTYYLWYYVEGDGNHNSTDVNTTGISKSIDKANGAATLSSSSVAFGTSTANQTVTVSGNTGTVSASVTSGSGCTVSVSGTTITITRNSNAAFSATITVTIAESTNYNSTTKAISVSGTAVLRNMTSATSGDIGKVICSNGHIHSNVSDVTCGGSASAMIAYVGNQNNAYGNGAYSSTCNHGLAIALADVINTSGNLQTAASHTNYLTWENAKTACSSFKGSKPSGVTWMLPSAYQWERMLIGCGSTATYVAYSSQSFGSFSYGNFRTKLTSCGNNTQGVYDVQSDGYWSSTEASSSTAGAWGYYFDYSNFNGRSKARNLYVRACYAF